MLNPLLLGMRMTTICRKSPEERLKLELFGRVLMALISISELFILLGKRYKLVSKKKIDCCSRTRTKDGSRPSIRLGTISCACMMSPPSSDALCLLFNSLLKKFPGNLWLDTEPACQTVHKELANNVIKATHLLRSHKFILWVCNE